MKELPILMSTTMVKATMEGTKTKTRRIIKNPNFLSEPKYIDNIKGTNLWTDGTGEIVKCPYGTVGDILWVRETHSLIGDNVIYKFDKNNEDNAGLIEMLDLKWKPSIFMKREHSRISLLVKNVKIERLNDISESDAIAEGIKPLVSGCEETTRQMYENYLPVGFIELPPIDSYKSLWESINGVGTWEDNPLVWVVEFEKM